MTSASRESTSASSHVVISSNAASLAFQLASPSPVITDGGIKSAARASASYDECLYLTVSRLTAAALEAAFPEGFPAEPPGAGFFAALAAFAAGAAAAGFLT